MADTGPPKSKTTAANVRAEIARSGLTHKVAADHMAMPYHRFRRRITGETDWRAGELEALARALGVPVARLTEEPKP